MRIEEFDYPLPSHLIAQEPPARRGTSRLLVLERGKGISHHRFSEIVNYLREGDVLVLNDAKVIPARLHGLKKGTGGKVEVLLLEKLEEKVWKVAVRGRKILPGTWIEFPEGIMAEVIDDVEGKRIVKFHSSLSMREILNRIGEVPLPPYIKFPTDRSFRKYQTVYARKNGAVAAPTAGFHFTKGILEKIRKKGVEIVSLTLYVGWGTFAPVKVEEVEKHKMEREFYELSEETARIINERKEKGGRIVAVGTTVVRVLETCRKEGRLIPGKGWTELFIYPGYQFKAVDLLLTNFHLPRSTPLLLVCAFAGKEAIFSAYQEAIKEGYRFYSFGDAMLII
ncbi:tRNA preQ1(34) S-adenosylmethionine ribosyltransferase-isomerase QueA [Candidatus Calescamantes bacterium]|nr:tRNA preQ1(34) S-adenosylmethionine ribosyltransferase-isomerase QueA [Candidatus Calescamantes bacterium]